MGQISLRHNVAFAAALAILDMVAQCLREEEQRDAFSMFYEAIKAAIEQYETAMQREAARLCKPSRN